VLKDPILDSGKKNKPIIIIAGITCVYSSFLKFLARLAEKSIRNLRSAGFKGLKPANLGVFLGSPQKTVIWLLFLLVFARVKPRLCKHFCRGPQSFAMHPFISLTSSVNSKSFIKVCKFAMRLEPVEYAI
jgi:hypothetical protein